MRIIRTLKSKGYFPYGKGMKKCTVLNRTFYLAHALVKSAFILIKGYCNANRAICY